MAASGVIGAWLEKAAIYRQAPGGTAELLDHMFLAELAVTDLHDRYRGNVVGEAGRTLAVFRSGGRLSYVNEWLLDRQARSYGSLAALDEAVPNGLCSCRIADARGEHEFALVLGGGDAHARLPEPPVVSLSQNGHSCDGFDSDAAIEIAWTPFSPLPRPEGLSALFAEPTIYVLVDNCRGETVFSSGSGARRPSLPVNARSLVIPGGILEPGLRYTVFVSFIDYRAGGQSADGAVAGVSVHSCMVELAFATAGDPADSRSCPPVEQRACYRWPGKLDNGDGLMPWPVAAGGLTLEPAADLCAARW